MEERTKAIDETINGLTRISLNGKMTRREKEILCTATDLLEEFLSLEHRM